MKRPSSSSSTAEPQTFNRRTALILLALLPIIPLWRAIFLGEGLGPFDAILANGAGSWDVLQADGVLQFAVWRGLVLQSWSGFEPPFWNPYQLFGTPLLANSQSGALYPLHIIFGALQLPARLSITLLAWIHLAILGIGTFHMARRLGATELGSIVAGAAFALSPFVLAWTPLASVPTTLAWLPWCAYFALGCSTEERKWRQAAGLAACVGLMVLAGHLQFAAYGLMAAVVAGAVGVLQAKAWGRLVPLAAGLAVGGMLAAPHIMPVLEFSKFSHRQNTPSAEGYAAFLGGAQGLHSAASLGMAHTNGLPAQDGPELMPGRQGTSYLPAYSVRGANFAENTITLGPLIIGLLALAWRRWKQALPGLAIGVLGLLLAFPTPLNALLYFGVPGWSATGSPGRAACLMLFGLIVTAALAWRTDEKEGFNARAAMIVGGLALLSCIPLSSLAAPADIPTVAAPWMGIGLPLLILAGAGIAAFYCLQQGKQKMALILALLGLVGLAGPAAIITGKADYPTSKDGFERSAWTNENWEIVVAAPGTQMFPNLASASRQHDAAGYDSLMHRETVALLADINGGDPAPPANGNIMLIKPSADPQKLADAGITAINGQKLDGPGRASVNGEPAEWIHDGFTSQKLTAPATGTLVIRDRNMPGWTAYVNGKSAPLGGDLWREVEVQEGDVVELRYSPPGFRSGIAVGLIGLILAVGLAIYRRRESGSPDGAEAIA